MWVFLSEPPYDLAFFGEECSDWGRGPSFEFEFLQLCRSCSKTFAIPYSNSHEGWSKGPVKKGPSGNHFLKERS